MGIKNYIVRNRLGLVLSDKRFSELTTMKVGGKIKNLYYPTTIDNLVGVINFLNQKKKRFFVLGNGSNIIASDKTFKHLVISGKHLIKSIEFSEDYFIVSAFMDLRIVIARLIERQISTLTSLAGIPATIGGALVMNAGANHENISDNLLWVKYLENGQIIQKNKDELVFGYRNSEFKRYNIIILEAAFKIVKDNETIFNYRKIIEARRSKHPINYPNSGSIFKNFPNKKAYEIIKNLDIVNIRVGGAKFSELHSNFIINIMNAKAKDVFNLIWLAKKRALEFENVNLEEEVILLNFPKNKYSKNH